MADPGVGRYLVAFSLQGVVFIALLFVVELQPARTLRRLVGALCRRRRKVRRGGGGGWGRGSHRHHMLEL